MAANRINPFVLSGVPRGLFPFFVFRFCQGLMLETSAGRQLTRRCCGLVAVSRYCLCLFCSFLMTHLVGFTWALDLHDKSDSFQNYFNPYSWCSVFKITILYYLLSSSFASHPFFSPPVIHRNCRSSFLIHFLQLSMGEFGFQLSCHS